MPWQCYICQEPSEDICAHCTKDTCSNHLCELCRRCSDCCECKELPVARVEATSAETDDLPRV